MAIKKSELYSSLWAGADALRGGMDASQYKDYVLVLLFLKYVSDKAEADPYALIEVPKGASFKDVAALKGTKDIGEQIDIAIGKIAKANDLQNVIDVVSFNDEEKLGKGKEMIDRLSDLVAIFENPALNFSKNKAGGDDILGDAYEFLMRHFATESGKAKGQFYTPSEVSRIMALVIGIKKGVKQNQSFYDPTSGSGSLLLKVADECDGSASLFGQEKDVATAALAKMNMILHNNPTAEIKKGQSTLSNPLFINEQGNLKTFDYSVANPPFSLKNWTQGFNPQEDEFGRFTGFGIPPEKNGDYAFLLHIIASLKSTGKGAVILPHGVLFRGNAEAEIRKNIIKQGFIKGIIGLPANLFYGTGIPACIIVIDKEDAEKRQGIFMVDASKGFMKDGNKNRLRDQDIHKIVDVFNKQLEIPKYSCFVPNTEIADPKNDYNLNIPRYIDSQEAEDIQDIAAHLLGGIPERDVDALSPYWDAYPRLKDALFIKSKRAGYYDSKLEKDAIKQTIFNHPDFKAFSARMSDVFNAWAKDTSKTLKGLQTGFKPKEIIHQIAEDLLTTYEGKALLDRYDVYQHLMNYWNDMMQDDLYQITEDGWVAKPYRIMEKNKKTGKETDKGWTCDLVPPSLIIQQYFKTEKDALEAMEAEKESLAAQLTELEEEHSGDEGYFAEFDKINKGTVTKRIKELQAAKPKAKKESFAMAAEDPASYGELAVMEQYMELSDKQVKVNADIKKASEALDKKAWEQYSKLTTEDVKQLVVDAKWMSAMQTAIEGEMERISQRLTGRIKELMERYETPLPAIDKELTELEYKVNAHLQKMGFVW
ncbi:MAG: N-6 DNA methylase [Bacteroidia bacterium]|nr:N-6 DNA methylase [Bacteroidia bacterium]